tara:strand:- start:1134 stop:2072 length:939 start_codon:yes stop_codon:yes gene_type:complete
MGLRVRSVIIGAILAASLVTVPSASGQDLDSWELGIKYPGEDATNSFVLSDDGSIKVEFFVENSGLTEITVQFEYNIPFGGSHEGPEEESISSGANDTFDLKISGIDVLSQDAEKKEKFSITATITARQGIPDPLSSSQNREGDLEIPSIFDLVVDISDPFGPMNAGSDTILTVTVRNDGNAQDGVAEVDVRDDCPLLTTDNGLNALLSGNIESGRSKDADLKVTASESHPKRHCDITISVTSKRNGASGASEDEVRVTVEPPPTGDSNSGGQDNDVSDTEDSIESNLSAPGLGVLSVGLLAALAYANRIED